MTTCQPLASFVPGMDGVSFSGPIGLVVRGDRRTIERRGTNPLERLCQLTRSNDGLMADLAASRDRIDRAREYLDSPGANARFGSAHLERCRGKHSAILAGLRANRIEALALLAAAGPPAAPAPLD